VEKIFSETTGRLLHLIYRKTDFLGREELVPEQENLQVAALKISVGNKFKPHRHIFKQINQTETIAQESWVVIAGRVEVDYFDEKDDFIQSVILGAGDCSITLYGGHGYSVDADSLIYEFKTGPYLGQSLDKVWI
jgi:hypothetical protein